MAEWQARRDAAAPRAEVKGTLLVARVRYLRSRPDGAFERALAALPEPDGALLRGILLPSSWYPGDLLYRLDGAIASAVGQGDRGRVFFEMGRFSAQTSLGPGGVQRPYLREDDPHHVLERVPRIYLAQHSAGSRSYHRTGERAAVIRRSAGEAVTADDCLIVAGWLQRAVELSGGAQVQVVERQCQARGGAHCEYALSWVAAAPLLARPG
jgi:uncharacterized protein (TIGR02265 family)